MPTPASGDRLSPLDALFVYLEKKEMPLHIGSVGIFDGPIPMNRLKALVEAKLPLIPRYRQRIVFPPLYLGHPTWEWDPEFDIDRHFSRTHLKHGTMEELEALAGEHFEKIMDRRHPLWDILVVDGVEGGRSALMVRVHHCLVDGIAGVALMNTMFDTSPKPAPLPKAKPFHPPKSQETATPIADALVGAYEEFTTRLLSAQSAVLSFTQALLGEPPVGAFDQFPGAMPFVVERLPFNKPVLGPRKFAWTEIPLAEIKAIRNAVGGTVNDVILMSVTGAVRRYSEFHGHSMQGRIMRYMVPVNLRRDPLAPDMGNSISILPVNVPLDVSDPVELLHAIHSITETVKGAHVTDMITMVAKWLGTTPALFQVAFGLLGNNLPLPPWNMVCTNVPGPPFPLYMLGRKLLTAYPYVPIGNDMGVNCAVESYNGTMFINFAGDTKAAPDLWRLRDFLVQSYEELRDRAGVAPPERPQAEAKPAPRQKKAAPPEPPPAKAKRASRQKKAAPPEPSQVEAQAAPSLKETPPPEPPLAKVKRAPRQKKSAPPESLQVEAQAAPSLNATPPRARRKRAEANGHGVVAVPAPATETPEVEPVVAPEQSAAEPQAGLEMAEEVTLVS